MLPLLLLATVAAAAAAAASPSPASSSRATITRPPPTPTPTTTTRTLTPSYQRRQEVSNLFGVQSTSSLHVAATVVSVAPTGTPSADATTTEAGELKQWSTVPVAASMGLIMPEPGSKILVNHTYDFGWIEDGQRPAPYALGWLRIIQPMLILPNYTVDIFPATGSIDPTNWTEANPLLYTALCAAPVVDNWSYSYSFTFDRPGWHMFVVNETWVRPHVENNMCGYPLETELAFFATQTFSVQPWNTGIEPPSSTIASTLWNKVTTQTPGILPFDVKPTTKKEGFAIGMAVLASGIGVALIVFTIFWVRSRHRAQREIAAYDFMRPQERQEFLNENPEHPLNPYRQTKHHYWRLRLLHDPPGSKPIHWTAPEIGYYNPYGQYEQLSPTTYQPFPQNDTYGVASAYPAGGPRGPRGHVPTESMFRPMGPGYVYDPPPPSESGASLSSQGAPPGQRASVISVDKPLPTAPGVTQNNRIGEKVIPAAQTQWQPQEEAAVHLQPLPSTSALPAGVTQAMVDQGKRVEQRLRHMKMPYWLSALGGAKRGPDSVMSAPPTDPPLPTKPDTWGLMPQAAEPSLESHNRYPAAMSNDPPMSFDASVGQNQPNMPSAAPAAAPSLYPQSAAAAPSIYPQFAAPAPSIYPQSMNPLLPAGAPNTSIYNQEYTRLQSYPPSEAPEAFGAGPASTRWGAGVASTRMVSMSNRVEGYKARKSKRVLRKQPPPLTVVESEPVPQEHPSAGPSQFAYQQQQQQQQHQYIQPQHVASSSRLQPVAGYQSPYDKPLPDPSIKMPLPQKASPLVRQERERQRQWMYPDSAASGQ